MMPAANVSLLNIKPPLQPDFSLAKTCQPRLCAFDSGVFPVFNCFLRLVGRSGSGCRWPFSRMAATASLARVGIWFSGPMAGSSHCREGIQARLKQHRIMPVSTKDQHQQLRRCAVGAWSDSVARLGATCCAGSRRQHGMPLSKPMD